MGRKTKVFGGLALSAFALSLVALFIAGRMGVKGDGGTGMVPEGDTWEGGGGVVGAIPGDEVQSDTFTINGVKRHYRFQPSFPLSTTTPCTLKSPTSTTTLERLTFDVRKATGTAMTITFATSTLQNATTTLVRAENMDAGRAGTFSWSPTVGTNNGAVPPNTYLNIGLDGVAAAAANGHQIQGNCSATFVGTR